MRRVISISESEAEFFRALGKRVAQARKGLGMTQLQLAECLGISQPMLASYEIGRRRLPASLLCPLARCLKCSVELLLDAEPATNGKPGPAPKLQRQIEQVRQLPRSRQKLVSDLLDTVLKSEQAS